ncbi:MAG: methylated-DNA--[protein]-cysteine S-methyltransferase [Magnetococcales bacterium]|nr:methylated-DNA--[protein]-cysteine S-methyltransferase [Magnetococcales bacterium]MBF0150231.1 methylated-DNA--[protein]-cysteine S-methyltransferase [Magnetococcales bacterium]MBF0172561.1 methylated-DNA--[protein]-cysteine S-methyltransferase [Magnetococcales bacterium]MBF0348471.1 methylated-DNA--[protein]-cysteine S-methyltransferase [Magnetococcales bacterium]MBF0630014.1 methylated-DNA--[protein]-cysteine S-methyltransferase [Magnetococcales bacterium]
MTDQGVVSLAFKPLSASSHPDDPFPEHPLRSWVEDYFAKRFHPPTFPLNPEGTLFQRRAWAEASTIPAGTVVTYGQLAARLNTAPRAIGQAMAANPIPLLIPCHRIIAANGGMGGYSGGQGIDTKRWLLSWEGA